MYRICNNSVRARPMNCKNFQRAERDMWSISLHISTLHIVDDLG